MKRMKRGGGGVCRLRSGVCLGGCVICLFLSNAKNFEKNSKNPLTMLGMCDKIVNCIIIAYTMGISALRQGSVSMKGDFSRLYLCILTNASDERSIRLQPWHLPCPWVVRLTHEVPDVLVPCLCPLHSVCLPLIPRHRRESPVGAHQ